MKQKLTSLDYVPDTASWVEGAMAVPWSIFLDSGGRGRYDIVATDPVITFVTRAGQTRIVRDGRSSTTSEDPLVVLREHLQEFTSAAFDLPFAGGAIGYFGYDLGRRWLQIQTHSRPDPVPEMVVGIYRNLVVVDHARRAALHTGVADESLFWRDLVRAAARNDQPGAPVRAADISSDLNAEAYQARFERVQEYLRAGDCYQVNLAQRFSLPVLDHPWQVYRRLRDLSPAPFGAYLNLPDAQILCNSPERFVEVCGGQVTTRPIKGTRPRDSDPKADQAVAEQLLNSPKDRAENLMIVDLLRNDLSKNCVEVKVPELFELESFATVHHLVSTVNGHLRADRDVFDLLRGCLPGGSVTGAPKRRAMQIIDELEPAGRGVYCGSIGYIGFDGNTDTNIAIRTLVQDEHGARFWAGGGIVAESTWEAEYAECLAKAKALFRALTGGLEMRALAQEMCVRQRQSHQSVEST